MTTRNTSSSDGFSEDKRYPREENSSNTSQSFATVVNVGYFAFILLLVTLWAYESFASLGQGPDP